MSEPPLELEDVSHAYAGTPVLDRVSLRLPPSQLVALLGPSGCGKTTLLRAVAGLATPSAGRIRLGGQLVSADGRDLVPPERRGVGLVFQSYALFPHMSVRENVGFGLARPDPRRVDELLELVGLSDLGGRRPGALSGGQQQRVALARALAPRPRLLLLDEPFASVDATLRLRLGAELRRALAAEATSGLLVTHDPADALRLGDAVAVLAPGPGGGRLLQCAPPEQVYAEPATQEVARLTGPVSFLTGEARGEVAETPAGALPLRRPAQGAVRLVLRPEQVRFVPEPAATGEGGSGSGAVVVECAFVGHAHRVLVRLGAEEVGCEARGAVPLGARGSLQVLEPAWALPIEPSALSPQPSG